MEASEKLCVCFQFICLCAFTLLIFIGGHPVRSIFCAYASRCNVEGCMEHGVIEHNIVTGRIGKEIVTSYYYCEPHYGMLILDSLSQSYCTHHN